MVETKRRKKQVKLILIMLFKPKYQKSCHFKISSFFVIIVKIIKEKFTFSVLTRSL